MSADGTFAVVLKETGLPVESIGIIAPQASHTEIKENECEIGYWIGKPCQLMGDVRTEHFSVITKKGWILLMDD